MSLRAANAASVLLVTALVSGCGLFPSSGGNQPPAGVGGAAGGGPPAGTGGSGPGLVMKDPSAYPQNSPGATFPYPQGHALPHCAFPAYNTDSVAAAYTNWKTKFYQGGRIIRTENSNDTVSEGIGYGMLIGVYMNDKPMFDTLWAYARSKFDGKGLMNWNISSTGAVIGGGGATDGDEDMAWALLMAEKQWGGGTYNSAAVTLINAIWSNEVDTGGGNVLKPGDNFGGANQTDPSYFAPSYYRVFARATNNTGWMSVVDSSYSILAKATGTYGLVPNWVNAQGAGVSGPGNAASDVDFGYDACRIPWRIALDYCENGEARAMAYLQKIVGFYVTTSAPGLGAIKDGYTVTGGVPPAPLGAYAAGMAFLGPAGVAAMSGAGTPLASNVYTTLVAYTSGPYMALSGVFTYFNASWGVLSLLTMSGNFWNMSP
jgi:endo-1,4-beta-D-glucanase Y